MRDPERVGAIKGGQLLAKHGSSTALVTGINLDEWEGPGLVRK